MLARGKSKSRSKSQSTASTAPPIDDALLLRPAAELGAQVRAGSVRAATLVEAYARRLRLVNGAVNGVCEENFEEAARAARAIDALVKRANHDDDGGASAQLSADEQVLLSSPLLGVPLTVKESICVEGKRNSCGLWARREERARADAAVVRAARKLGLIPIATSNIPEATLYWSDCNNKVYGRTRNPYDTRRMTGASSGGEGALLGAGASLLGIGSDVGGSLRLPAHFCGVNSHKASPFLLSADGNFPAVKNFRLRLFTFGPMARFASDLRPMLKCLLAGQHSVDAALERQSRGGPPAKLVAGEPPAMAEKRASVARSLDAPADLSTLTVCYVEFADSKLRASLNVRPEIVAAQRALIDRLAEHSHCKLRAVNLDAFLDGQLETWQHLLHGLAAPGVKLATAPTSAKGKSDAGDGDERSGGSSLDEHDAISELFGIRSLPLELCKLLVGQQSKHTVEALLTLAYGIKIPGSQRRAVQLARVAEERAERQRRQFVELLGARAVLVFPTMPSTAYRHSHSLLKSQDIRFTCLFNSLQVPATHVTFGLSEARRLPFGFSCVAPPFDDNLCLSVAEQVERLFGGWREPATGRSAAEARAALSAEGVASH